VPLSERERRKEGIEEGIECRVDKVEKEEEEKIRLVDRRRK
jgi:hypothetical protein